MKTSIRSTKRPAPSEMKMEKSIEVWNPLDLMAAHHGSRRAGLARRYL